MTERATQRPSMARVERIAGDRVHLITSDGRALTRTLGGLRLLRHSRADPTALNPGERVVVPGGGAGRGPLRGRVVAGTPPRIETLGGGTRPLPPGALVLREHEIGRDALTPGTRVRLTPHALIVVDSGPGDGRPAGAPARRPLQTDATPPRAPMHRAPASLPMPETAPEDHFDRARMRASLDSPFGFFDPNMLRFQHTSWNQGYGETMRALGAHWASQGATFAFSWNLVQRHAVDGGREGYDWSRLDALVRYSQANNIHLVPILTASPPQPTGRRMARAISRKPDDTAAYGAFVRAAVERYDGDGRADMPGLRAPIRRWAVENEPYAKRYWQGDGADLADTLLLAHRAIRAADPDAEVIAGMVRGPGWHGDTDPRRFMDAFFDRLGARAGGERPYDYLDQHWIGTAPGVALERQYAELRTWIDDLERAAARNGFAPAPLVALEHAGRHEDERDQAEDVVKRHAYLLGSGFRLILWSGLRAAPERGAGPDHDYFRQVALIDADGRRKPAYHAYRRMTERLDDCDWPRTRLLHDQQGLVVVRFHCHGAPFLVAWSDRPGGSTAVRIPVEHAGTARVRVESALPDSGPAPRTLPLVDGAIRLDLDTTPRYLSADGPTGDPP
ncbi:hypothetical protein MARPU_14465 [Marichromatium purpuratum 984]|uniref:Glycoside hydrolase family 42 N-terminal domain-containing protein n=2 Tax=Marichromatium purpuratum TaxID=37487 RepID=W0E8R5_MARPU|nr:hypothetical protein MARPU_14465 [Marichromatium purpuratum 984]